MALHNVDVVIRAHDRASKTFGRVNVATSMLTRTLRTLIGTVGVYVGVRQIGRLLAYGAAFEKTMSRVGALSQATAEEHERLTAAAQRLGETTVFTAKQVADGMSFLALAGFNVDQVIAAMPATLNLAAAGQLELAAAADITAKIMKGMGHTTADLEKDVDVLAKAFTTANTDLVQLGEAMQYVGPVGRMAGKSLEELTAAIQMMSDAGIQASMAGTSLRQILTALSGGTPAAARALRDLEIQTVDLQGALLPLPNIIDQFNAKFAGLGKAERTAQVMLIFGKRAGPGMAAMLAEGGDALRKYEERLGDVAGTAKRIATLQLDNVAGEVTRLGSVASGIWLDIWNRIKGWLKEYIKAFREGLMVLAAIVQNFGKLMSLVWAYIKLGLVEFWEDMKHIFTVSLPNLLTWFAQNWKTIFSDMFNWLDTATYNMGQNLRKSIKGAWEGLHGETGGWEWTPISKGFKAELSTLPNLGKRVISELEKGLRGEIDTLTHDIAGAIIDKFEPGGKATAEGVPASQAGPMPDDGGAAESIVRGIKQSLAPLEARFLTFAPGREFDYARQTAKNTQEQLRQQRDNGKLLREIRRELEEANHRYQGTGYAETAFT